MIQRLIGRRALRCLQTHLLWAAALLLMFPSRAAADAILEYALETKLPAEESSLITVWLTDGKVTMTSTGNQSTRAIYWAKDDRLAVMDDAKKSYFEMTGGEMKEMAATMSNLSGQLSAAMASLSPEQKAMIDSQMKKAGLQVGGESGSSPEIEVLMLSETRRIQGFQCQKHDVIRDGAKCAEAWSTPVTDITVTMAELQAVTGMTNMVSQLMESMAPMMKSFGFELSIPTGFADGLEGFPVYVKELNGDAIRSEMTLQSLTRGKIEKSVFEIGKGYEKHDLSGGQ